jgi:hypothetical protein
LDIVRCFFPFGYRIVDFADLFPLAQKVDHAWRYDYCCDCVHLVRYKCRLVDQDGRANITESSLTRVSRSGERFLYDWRQSYKDAASGCCPPYP